MIALFNILVSQKRGISIKEKQTAQPGNVRESYARQNTQIHAPKKKKNFLYSNEGTIDYNQQCHPLHLRNKQYKEFPQKKKRVRKRRGRRRKRKREREEERMRKRGRGSEKKEREGEERRERERRGEKGESSTKSTSLSPDAFPSMKLGNNITPIKGRQRKNTTPNGRGASEPSRNPWADPLRRRPSLDALSSTNSSCAPKREKGSKYELHREEVAIYREAKALGKSCSRFQFSIDQH